MKVGVSGGKGRKKGTYPFFVEKKGYVPFFRPFFPQLTRSQ